MVFDQATFYHDLIKQSGQPIMKNVYQGIIERGTGIIMLCDETVDEYITVSAEDMAWLNKYLSD